MMEQDLTDTQKIEWIRLLKSENIGPYTFRSLLNRFGGATQALQALPELSRRGGMGKPLKICSAQEAERDFEKILQLRGHLIAIGEPLYPSLLRQIYKAPPLLCAKGNLELLKQPIVGMVGTRNASAAGLKFTRQIAMALGKAGYVVTSGLARGIDTAAHQSSLATGTIACVAGGIDVVYPPENAKLHELISEEGVLLSEHMPETVPNAKNFPQRNRIISGLSQIVVVVEASLKSGSLITAEYALEQGREVFAAPGSPLDSRSTGTNRLIQEGAALMSCPEDVLKRLDELKAFPKQPEEFFMEDPNETALKTWATHPVIPDELRATLLSLLSYVPTNVDELICETGEPAYLIQAALLELEIAGKAMRLSNNRVVCCLPEPIEIR